MSTEKLSSKGQAWFCTTGLPSDIVIEVDDMSFHLHKFPLMFKSRKLHQIITEEEGSPRKRKGTSTDAKPVQEEVEEDEEIVEEPCHISLPEFPGGSETFETAAKFCYGVKIDLTATNVAPLRCAGEYLEMTEEFSEDNLISKTERFLSQSVLRSLRDSIRTLKSCEALMPMAETLGIAHRCIDSVAARASSSDPSLFGWPVSDKLSDPLVRNPVLQNGIDTGARCKNPAGSATDFWLEDMSLLNLPLYKRLISAMKDRDLSSEIIEGFLISYAKRSIPGLSSRSSRKHSSSSLASEAEQRELLETVVSNLQLNKTSGSTSSTRFLFGMLKTANVLNASASCKTVLEKKIASQLELATLDDLLLPSYSYLIETLYNVDCVERILAYFLEGSDERSMAPETDQAEGESPGLPSVNPVILVGKLIDGYLSEIASDANLKPEKFYNLAVALPYHARLFDDGLYRATDVYLKAHPWISEEEREKLCGAMDCQKLTLEACTHAAQNERLPLRAVVQVLFFEQLQLRHAIAGSLLSADFAPMPDSVRSSRMEGDITPAAVGVVEGDAWRSAIRENQVLRLDMDGMRSRVNELERECSTMRKAIEKIDKSSMAVAAGGGGWSSFTRNFGCKFRTQVCDSHDRTVVETRRAGKQGQQQTRLQEEESL
ncbi:BTB/POZ domain-containing protein At5g66560-like [Aristolochia californica]|uniref:BTB/POZ domain-containing protein At5g66560-like n=1 Tax=Aristolochia californica TaxID=171875 RepID=UPI0035DE3CD0